MPRKARQTSIADEHAAPGGAAAVDRALSLLAAFATPKPNGEDGALTLAELAERTRLYKSTALRLLASLEHAELVRRTADGRYRLGPGVARLHARYAADFSLEAVLMPVLRDLVASTRESAALHVRQGDQRLCLLRVDSPQLLRDHVRVGDLLPLDRGAGGRVLLAFSGTRGRLYDQIRSAGVALMSSDRVEGLVGVSAPVWGVAGELVGALTLTLLEQRMRPAFVGEVIAAAALASARLGAPQKGGPAG